MQKRSKAIPDGRLSEQLAWLAFFIGSGFALFTLLSEWTPYVASIEGVDLPKRDLSSSWTDVRAFDAPPSLDPLLKQHSELKKEASEVILRKVEIVRSFQIVSPLLLPLDQFEHFSLRPVRPFPGSVFKIGVGPQCLMFSWSEIPLPQVRYTLEIAKTRNFEHFRSLGSAANFIRIRVSRKADLFWRVRANLGRSEMVSPVSSYLTVEPALTPEEESLRELASQVRQSTAWLSDISYCD
jgi:hypothetical protein